MKRSLIALGAVAFLLALITGSLAQTETFTNFILAAPAGSPTTTDAIPCIEGNGASFQTRRCTPPALLNLLTAAQVKTALGYTPAQPFASIAALRANTAVVPVAYVQGYVAGTPSDGGEGFFVANGTTCVDNSGTIIKDSEPTPVCYYRQIGGQPYSVKWFGAKGDGVTDDRTAFFNANAAAGVTGTIYVPPSNNPYLINSALTITAGYLFAPTGTIKPVSSVAFNGSFAGPSSKAFDLSAGGNASLTSTIVGSIPASAAWWGVVGDGVTDNTTALQAAIKYAPYKLDINTPGIVKFTGVTLDAASGHEFGGLGYSTINYLSCSGLAYAHAAELPGTYAATSTFCFQNGAANGALRTIYKNLTVQVSDTSTVIPVGVMDSTSTTMSDGYDCENSSFTGFIGWYWGQSSFAHMLGCTMVGNAGGEVFQAPNVAGLHMSSIQKVVHVGGVVSQLQTTSGGALVQLDPGGKRTIADNVWINTAFTNGFIGLTVVQGNGFQSFYAPQIENFSSRTFLGAANNSASIYQPFVSGTNSLTQLIGDLDCSAVVFQTGSITHKTGCVAGVQLGQPIFNYGTGNPNGSISGSPGDVYVNLSGGANATFWWKQSGAATTTGWVAAIDPTQPPGIGTTTPSSGKFTTLWQSARNAFYSSATANPSGTSSPTLRMMGLGSTWVINPSFSGRVKFLAVGTAQNNQSSTYTQIGCRYGTGLPPANGDAVTGTACNTNDLRIVANAIGNIGSTFTYYSEISPLSTSTGYWFDLPILAGNAGTSVLQNLIVSIEEF